MTTNQTNSDQTDRITPSFPTTLIVKTLQRCDGKRLESAVDALLSGSLRVDITYCDETAIRALVRNGDGVAYSVVLTDAETLCNCADATYRTGTG